MNIIVEFIHSILWVKRLLLNEYSIPELELIKRMISKNAYCIDIGAHAGSWTFPLSRKVPNGKVIAFEALPYYARVLRMALSVLMVKNVSIVNCALMESKGIVNLQWKSNDGHRLTGRTHVAFNEEPLVDPVAVSATTLDSYLGEMGYSEKRVELIKIDIEGAELPALIGARESLVKWMPILYVEIYADYCLRFGYTYDVLFGYLADIGYKPYVFDAQQRLIGIGVESYSGAGDVLFLNASVDFSRIVREDT